MSSTVVETKTGSKYSFDEARKMVTGGFFGKETVPYRYFKMLGVGKRLLIDTGEKEITTAPITSISLGIKITLPRSSRRLLQA